jgi:hypothetical protein
VAKRVEKTERSKRKQAVGQEYRGRQIKKEDGSWTNQQAEKATNGCFGAPRKKEGKTGWQSLENMGQVIVSITKREVLSGEISLCCKIFNWVRISTLQLGA